MDHSLHSIAAVHARGNVGKWCMDGETAGRCAVGDLKAHAFIGGDHKR